MGWLAFAGQAGTEVEVVSCADYAAVDSAVSILCEHQILGVEAFWSPETQAGDYKNVCAIALSCGTHTFYFQLQQPESLPMCLQLLLTHNDYTKVGFSIFQGLLGKTWRDFGVQLNPLHDVEDLMQQDLATSDLYVAFTMQYPGSRFAYDRSLRYSQWDREDVADVQIEYAAFCAWACRSIWLHLAQPQGYPPRSRSTAVDTDALCAQITCNNCSARLHGPDALKAHIAKACMATIGNGGGLTTKQGQVLINFLNQDLVCSFCGRGFTSLKDLRQHQYARVNGLCYSKDHTQGLRPGTADASHIPARDGDGDGLHYARGAGGNGGVSAVARGHVSFVGDDAPHGEVSIAYNDRPTHLDEPAAVAMGAQSFASFVDPNMTNPAVLRGTGNPNASLSRSHLISQPSARSTGVIPPSPMNASRPAAAATAPRPASSSSSSFRAPAPVSRPTRTPTASRLQDFDTASEGPANTTVFTPRHGGAREGGQLRRSMSDDHVLGSVGHNHQHQQGLGGSLRMPSSAQGEDEGRAYGGEGGNAASTPRKQWNKTAPSPYRTSQQQQQQRLSSSMSSAPKSQWPSSQGAGTYVVEQDGLQFFGGSEIGAQDDDAGSILSTSMSRSQRYPNRTPQPKPGDVRWIEPPYRDKTPLKIARSADKVGLI